MTRRKGLMDAWTRFGNEMMSSVPTDPRKMADWIRAPTRMAGDIHDAWLESVGGVSRARYVELLEENLRLRRRIEELENRGPADEAAEAAAGAMDGAFDRMREAQDRWLSMWLPKNERSSS